MADNVIKYSDLIRPDDSIKILIEQLEQVQTELKGVTSQAGQLSAATKKVNSVTTESQETIKENAVLADKLDKEYNKLKQSQTNLGIEIKKMQEINKEQNRLTKLELQLNEAKAGSYNKLSAQYSINKIKLNQMSAAQRQGTAAGRQLEAQTKKIYLEMQKLQEATGKHTLSVGNYAKGFYGLNTAVNQVTRELPVLGMNLNTFFLAISNNIPMLVDEIDRLRIANKQAIEQGKASIPVGKAVMKALFSWQTALSVGVALLTIYGKDIVEWIGRLGKSKDAVNAQTKALEELNDVMGEGAKNAQKELTQLKLLYDASQKEAGGREDQTKAIKQLKKEWPEYFQNLTEEEIMAGKAANTYLRLAEAIIKTAQARAAQNKLVANYERLLEIDIEREDLLKTIDETNQKRDKDDQKYANKTTFRLSERGKALAKNSKLVGEYNEILLFNQKLIDRIDIGDLFDDDKTKKSLDKTLEYMRAWTDSYTDLREDGLAKDLTITEYKYAREIEALQSQLRTDENLTEKGREAINGIIINLQLKLNQELAKLRAKDMENRQKEIGERIAEEEKYKQDSYKIFEDKYNQEYELELSQIDIMEGTQAEKEKLRLEAEKRMWEKILQLNQGSMKQLNDLQVQTIKNTIGAIEQEIGKVGEKDIDIYSLLGFDLNTEQQKAIESSFKYATDNLDEYVDAMLEAADKKVDAANEQVEAAQSLVDAEIEARNNGYAYNVTAAQKELDLAKKTEEKALKEQEKAQKAQLLLDSVSQASNMVTASAKIWGTLGFPFAIPALAIMWGSFIGAKIKASQVTKQTYGEGGLEILDGGSHQSGNDVALGTTKDGKDRRAEGGEAMMIVRKSKTRKYRKLLPGISDALNKGIFEKKYMNAYNMAGADTIVLNGGTDLSTLEGGVEALKKQGERRFFVDGKGRTVERYKNLTRVYNVN